MTRKAAILIFCLAILLGAGLLAYGALSRGADSPCEPKSEAAKLAELEAALVDAVATCSANQAESDKPSQTPANRTSRTRST